MINSLKYAKILEKEGLTRNLAEAHVKILGEVLGSELMTKTEFNYFKDGEFKRLKEDVDELKNDMKEVKEKLSSLENRLVLKLGSLIVGCTTILGLILSFK